MDDVVLVHNQFGTTQVRINGIVLREHGVKLTGRNEIGTQYSFGARHGEPLTLVDRSEDGPARESHAK